MLAFTVRNGRLVAASKPMPALRPGWALVRMRLAGICNTDLEILRGYHNFTGTPGHEFVGEVIRVRARTPGDTRWVGQRVVGDINTACAAYGYKKLCAYCRRGVLTHCSRRRVLGIVGHDGAFAEYLALPLSNLHRVADNIPDEQAVFTEPLAAGCEILEQIAIRQHREAAVLGDGKLAQLIVRVLAAADVRVTMFGRHANKLELARRGGAAAGHLQKSKFGKGATSAQLINKFGQKFGQRFTLVVEATGSAAGLALAQQLAAPRGTVVLKSTFHGAASVETWPIVVHELTLIGSRCGPFSRALKLLRGGGSRIDLRPMITKVFPLAEAPQAIRFASQRGVLKVLLKP
jgi:alcohol dehydrogenase